MTVSRRLQFLALAAVSLVVVALLLFSESLSWRELFLPALAAALAAVLLASFIAKTITGPLEELRSVTRSLAEGRLASRPPLVAPGELGGLSTAIHRLAEQLSLRIDALQSEDALLTALIESLNEGVVAIDSRQQAVRLNQSARVLLGINDRTPFPIDRLPRISALREAVRAALEGVITEPTEMMVGEQTLSVTARPLRGRGAVLAFFDLTEIRRLELVRRDFVANVSHELKTPLTVVGGFAETLATDELPEASRRQFAHTIVTHTQRMQRIVDDLLDLSRLESGKWVPATSTVDVRAAASEVLESIRPDAEEKGISLRLDVHRGAASVVADRTALRQVLTNLVENAVRHTATGSVTVFAEREEAGTWVGVTDTGVGISPQHLPRIFERFYRVDAGRARDTGGTGLGLAIVKHLVEAHGGRVSASSEPGKGTRIAAFFPESSSSS